MAALPQPLLPLIQQEFNLNYTKSALVQSSFAWTNGIAQIPAGFLADRINRRILLIIGICGVAVAGFLVGLSHTYMMMLVFLVVMGALGGGYHPAAAPMVSEAAPPEVRGRALGFHEMGASASFLVTPLVAAAIASGSSWRISFVSLAIPTFLIGLLLIRYTRRPETHMESTVTGTPVEDVMRAATPPPSKFRLVVFLLLSVLTGGIVSSVFAFITLYAVDVYGASTVGAASLLTLMYCTGLLISPVAGHLSDLFGRVPLIIAACLLGAFVVYMLNWAPYYWGIAGLMLLLGIATFSRMPVSEAYIIGQTTERNRSTIYGIYYFSMTETGAVFAPIMGYLIDNYGFSSCFNWASIATVVITLVGAFLLRGSRN
jgi:YNFM family putative membrane transporter